MNTLLEWEIMWINKNRQLYSSNIHADSVIQNIKKEYELKDIKKRIRKFRDTKTTGSYCELFEAAS